MTPMEQETGHSKNAEVVFKFETPPERVLNAVRVTAIPAFEQALSLAPGLSDRLRGVNQAHLLVTEIGVSRGGTEVVSVKALIVDRKLDVTDWMYQTLQDNGGERDIYRRHIRVVNIKDREALASERLAMLMYTTDVSNIPLRQDLSGPHSIANIGVTAARLVYSEVGDEAHIIPLPDTPI